MMCIYCSNDGCPDYRVAVAADDLIVPIEAVGCGSCAGMGTFLEAPAGSTPGDPVAVE